MQGSPTSVRYFPDYRDHNPYQDLLYRATAPRIDAQPIATTADLAAGAWQGAGQILHLHWETAPFLRGEITPEAYLDLLSDHRDRGGRIVWTVHNLAPHDPRLREVAAQVRDGLLTLADIVHFHSLPAVAAAKAAGWPLPDHKVRIIPHGSYSGAYPTYARAKARTELGLDEARMVVLLPGQIRDYKAPLEGVEAFLAVAGVDDRMLLRGHAAPDANVKAFPQDPRILSEFGFATAEDLAHAYAAADLVLLPYRQSLTSGTAVLAQSQARGVLGTDTPGLRDVVDMPRSGVLYDPTGPDALQTALETALAEGPEVWATRGAAAAEDDRARSFDIIGPMWVALFEEIARTPTAPRPNK